MHIVRAHWLQLDPGADSFRHIECIGASFITGSAAHNPAYDRACHHTVAAIHTRAADAAFGHAANYLEQRCKRLIGESSL